MEAGLAKAGFLAKTGRVEAGLGEQWQRWWYRGLPGTGYVPYIRFGNRKRSGRRAGTGDSSGSRKQKEWWYIGLPRVEVMFPTTDSEIKQKQEGWHWGSDSSGSRKR